MNLINRHPTEQRVADVPHSICIGLGKLVVDLFVVGLSFCVPEVLAIGTEPKSSYLKSSQCFLERLFERSPDRHRFANALHLRGQRGVGFGNFSNAKRGILVTT